LGEGPWRLKPICLGVRYPTKNEQAALLYSLEFALRHLDDWICHYRHSRNESILQLQATGSSTSLLAVGLRDLSDELGPGHIASLSPRGSEA
jgi:hypothetical protein